MAKSLEEWLLIPENKAEAAASKYDPAKLMEALENRRAALRDEQKKNDNRREVHRQFLRLLDGPHGQWMLEKAHAQIDKWQSRQLCHPRYIMMWRAILALPPEMREVEVLRQDDYGVSMRANSPFADSYSLLEK